MMLSGLRRLRCRRIRPALWDYVAERLSEGPLETVERHLAVCAACRRETEALRSAQELLAACRQAPIPPPRSDWSALRSRLQLEGATPVDGSHGYGSHGRTHLPRIPARGMRRDLPRRRNRWLPSLAASTACTTLLLLLAFGYRSLHPVASIRKDFGTQALAGGQNRTTVAQNGAVSNPASRPLGAPDDTDDPGFSSFDSEDGGWIDAPQPHFNNVQHVVASSDRHSELPHKAIPAANRVQEAPTVASLDQHRRQPHTGDARQPKPDQPHFRPYKPRPEDALPQNNADESRYAIDSVAPLGGTGGGAYLMPSVRPVQYNDNAPF